MVSLLTLNKLELTEMIQQAVGSESVLEKAPRSSKKTEETAN